MPRTSLSGSVMVAGFLLSVFLVGATPSGAQAPAPLVGVAVSSIVTTDSSGIYSYQYGIASPGTNQLSILGFAVDIELFIGDSALPANGLISGPDYQQNRSLLVAQQVRIVPVGITGPSGWKYGLGIDAKGAVHGNANWTAQDDIALLVPGTALYGFGLTSYGLPGIRQATLTPFIDTDSLPDLYSDPDEAKSLLDGLTVAINVIGPKAPPNSVTPLDFFDYLIGLVNSSRQNGWIRNDGVQQSLLTKLTNSKAAFAASQVVPSANLLRAFANEVQGNSCQALTCPGSKPLTSEAYSLLLHNAEFLRSRIEATR